MNCGVKLFANIPLRTLRSTTVDPNELPSNVTLIVRQKLLIPIVRHRSVVTSYLTSEREPPPGSYDFFCEHRSYTSLIGKALRRSNYCSRFGTSAVRIRVPGTRSLANALSFFISVLTHSRIFRHKLDSAEGVSRLCVIAYFALAFW